MKEKNRSAQRRYRERIKVRPMSDGVENTLEMEDLQCSCWTQPFWSHELDICKHCIAVSTGGVRREGPRTHSSSGGNEDAEGVSLKVHINRA